MTRIEPGPIRVRFASSASSASFASLLESQTHSNWRVDLRSLLAELLRLGRHAGLRCRIIPNVLRDLHRAELWPAHRAEMCDLGAVGRQRLVMVCASGDGVERQVELIDPTELEARLA